MTDLEQVKSILGRLCAHEPNSPELLWELLKSCTADVVLDTRYALADGQLYDGRKGVEQFFVEWLSSWEDWAWTPQEMFDTPQGVCLLVEERAMSPSGVPVKQRHIQQWQLKDGKVAEWTMFAHDYTPAFEEIAA